MGPLSSAQQYARVQEMIEAGVAEGARLVAGGPGKPEGFETGYYAQPTVLADVNNTMRIAQEEIFGPVLVMIPFDSEDVTRDELLPRIEATDEAWQRCRARSFHPGRHR